MPIRAVIFDFNGTLSDDEPVLCRIYGELFAEYGKPISDRDYYDALAGLAEHAIAALARPRRPAHPRLHPPSGSTVTGAVADGSTVTEPTARGGALRGRARAARDRLRRRARGDRAGRRRRRARRRCFAIVVADDDVARGKPDPEGYLLALERSASHGGRRSSSRTRRPASPSAKAAGHARRRGARDAGARAARAAPTSWSTRSTSSCSRRCSDDLVIAHRGASAEQPENTLPAFERAIELGADFVELDVHAAPTARSSSATTRREAGEPRLEEVVELSARADRDRCAS